MAPRSLPRPNLLRPRRTAGQPLPPFTRTVRIRVRRPGVQERAPVAGCRGRPLLAPGGAVVEGLGRHSLAEFAQSDIRGPCTVGFLKPLGGEGGLPVGDEKRFADRV